MEEGEGRPVHVDVRAAGPEPTWSRLHAFHPLHDLLHYAVETTLGYREAFFGLLVAGWTVDDFAAPGAAARLPAEAQWAEVIVGMLDQERAGTVQWDGDGLHDAVATHLTQHAGSVPPKLTQQQLETIRERFADLANRWRMTAPGETLSLAFPA